MAARALEALIPTSPARYIATGVRRIIVIMVLHGLLPGFGAVAAASAGVPARGEPTMTAASSPGGERSNPEHGCGVTLHLCSCCVSQAVVMPAVVSKLRELALAPRAAPGAERQLAHRAPDRPFRPPIR
jgi:hypothetical protein